MELSAPLPAHHTVKRAKGFRKEPIRKRRIARHFKMLAGFFDDARSFAIMQSVVNKKNGISLRMLEFVCTTFARRGLVVDSPTGTKVNVDAAYQDALRAHGKAFFDAFRRNKSTHNCNHRRNHRNKSMPA